MTAEQAQTWLLQPDDANPGVRYFALRWLLNKPDDDPDVEAAQTAGVVGEGGGQHLDSHIAPQPFITPP